MKSGSSHSSQITIISGGVGGAKLARGFVKAYPRSQINIITNTADDEEFFGLHVSPDLDTMLYTLSGIADKKQGWGIENDSFMALKHLARFGEPSWFRIGDKDLATHIVRTKMLRQGKTMTEITRHLALKLGIQARILPVTDRRIKTFIRTDTRWIPFQDYFVRLHQHVSIKRICFRGIRKAHATREACEAIQKARLIVFAPSNPIVSVLPILRVRPVRHLIARATSLRVAVSPFMNKKAISGPARELMESQGHEGSSSGLARFYSGLVDVLMIANADGEEVGQIRKAGIEAIPTQIIMKTTNDSIRLARRIVAIPRMRGKP